MGSVNPDIVDPDEYKSILEKTSKLNEKIQKQKRTAPKPQPKEQVKRIKLAEDFGKKKVGKPQKGLKENGKQIKNENVSGSVKKEEGDKSFEKFKPTAIKQEGEKTNWKEFKLEKKRLKLHRQKKKLQKTSKDDVQSVIELAKQLWIQLTLKTQPKAKQHEFARQLLDTIKGNVLKFALKHDTSRFLQAVISKGNPAVVDEVFQDLKDQILELSKGKYSHWCVVQLLKHGTKAHRQHIINSFDGAAVKLMNSSTGCRVLEEAFNDHATAKERARILQEFYSVDFRYAKDDNVRTLKDVLEQKPEKKTENLTRVNGLIKKLVAKGRWRLYLFHTLLYDYLSVAESDERTEILETAREHLLEMVHTKEGARVAMISLWEGDKKVRKQIVKSFKGKVLDVCKEAQGHRVLLALFDCVDDTVLVSKAILQEIVSSLDDVMASDSGRKVILYLFGLREKRFFDPDTIEFLSRGDGNTNTKKSIADIHSELQGAVVPALTDHLANNVAHYFKDNSLVFFYETVINYMPARAKIFRSIAAYVVEQDWDELAKVRSAWKCIAHLAYSVREDLADPDELLCLLLLKEIPSSSVAKIASSFEGKSLLCSLTLSFNEFFAKEKKTETYSEIVKVLKKAASKEGTEVLRKWISAVCKDREKVDDELKRFNKIIKA